MNLVSIRRGAVTESRKRKPGIPLIGDNEIPLRDEIELELRLPPQDPAGRARRRCISNTCPSPIFATSPAWILPSRRRMVLLVGGNAQGKTSILEAVYFLAAFASFQTHTDRQLVNFVEARNALAVTRLVGDYERNGDKHRLEVRLVLEPTGTNGQRLRKEILLDGVKKQANDDHRALQRRHLHPADVADHRGRAGRAPSLSQHGALAGRAELRRRAG